MEQTLTKTIHVESTARLAGIRGMFDLGDDQGLSVSWDLAKIRRELADDTWSIGLIHGPSGSGKTSIARELFGENIIDGFKWPKDKSIVDAFPAKMPLKEITGLLSSVGFSSTPAWVRPFHSLSNGEQFRVTLARTLAETRELAVIDEFTSVVDRQVAKVGSAAVAKAMRRQRGGLKRLICLSCHDDIIEWLDPDWTYNPQTDEFRWRRERRGVELSLEVERVHPAAWDLFRSHHYLDHNLSKSAICFVAKLEGTPCAFASALPLFHKIRAYREHRTVCLPDFQGVGIGQALSKFVASVFVGRGNFQYISTTSHPAMIAHRLRSPDWEMTRKPSRAARQQYINGGVKRRATSRQTSMLRLTAGFRYIGPPAPADVVAAMFPEHVPKVAHPGYWDVLDWLAAQGERWTSLSAVRRRLPPRLASGVDGVLAYLESRGDVERERHGKAVYYRVTAGKEEHDARG